jgi:hypothetical protein
VTIHERRPTQPDRVTTPPKPHRSDRGGRAAQLLDLQQRAGNRATAASVQREQAAQAPTAPLSIQRSLWTTKQLEGAMGEEPGKKSANYRAIHAALDAYHRSVRTQQQHDFAAAALANPDELTARYTAEEKAVLEAIDEVVHACSKDLGARADEGGLKKKAKGALGAVSSLFRGKGLKGKSRERFQKKSAVDQLQGAAIRERVDQMTVFEDRHEAHQKALAGNVTAPNLVLGTKLGSGNLNVAFRALVDLDHQLMAGVFKAEPKGQVGSGSAGTGIPEQNSRGNFRSVATYRLDQLFKTGVTPRTELAMDNQSRFGQFMALAPGRSPQGEEVDRPTTPADASNLAALQEAIDRIGILEKKMADGTAPNGAEFELDAHRSTLADLGARYKQDPAHKDTWLKVEKLYLDLDVVDARLQQGLSNLQVLDLITGQVDRHPGNYFIDMNTDTRAVRGVQGIDNDLAFGKNITDVNQLASSESQAVKLPKVVDSALAQRILGPPGITPDDVADAVKGLLTTEEIDALKQRYVQVKAHIQSLATQQQLASLQPAAGEMAWGAATHALQQGPKESYAQKLEVALAGREKFQ